MATTRKTSKTAAASKTVDVVAVSPADAALLDALRTFIASASGAAAVQAAAADVAESDSGTKEYSEMSVQELRDVLIEMQYDEDEVNAVKSKKQLLEIIAAAEGEGDEEEDADDEDESDEDEEEGDDEDAEGDEEDGYAREDLEELSLAQLKKILKEEFEWTTADLKGLDQESLVDAILGEGEYAEDGDEDEDAEDEEEDFEEDDEEGDDEEDEEEEEYPVYTKVQLKKKSDAVLKGIIKDYGIPLPRGKASNEKLVQMVLDAQNDAAEEE